MQTGEITAAARLDGNGGQTETEGGTATGEFANAGEADPTAVDTVIVVDKVQVTAIKQGMVLRSQPWQQPSSAAAPSNGGMSTP